MPDAIVCIGCGGSFVPLYPLWKNVFYKSRKHRADRYDRVAANVCCGTQYLPDGYPCAVAKSYIIFLIRENRMTNSGFLFLYDKSKDAASDLFQKFSLEYIRLFTLTSEYGIINLHFI